MHAFYSGLGMQAKIVIAILQLLIIYHFYVFYILKPARKQLVFWQVVVYFTLTGGGYFYLRCFRPDIYSYFFQTGYAAKIYSLSVAPALKPCCSAARATARRSSYEAPCWGSVKMRRSMPRF